MLLPSEPKRLYGCSGGVTDVQLRDAASNKTLDTVTVEVLPTLSIAAHEQVAYRWLNITFTGHPAYTYTVQWRKKGATKWNVLPTTAPSLTERSRVHIFGHSADIRGLPYGRCHTLREIDVRIGGRTAEGRASTSTAYALTRARRPEASGHQPDHAVGYSTSGLPAGGLGGMIINAVANAASAWSASPYLSITSGSGVNIELSDPNGVKCDPEPETACVDVVAPSNKQNPDYKLTSTMTMVFYLNPSINGIEYRWTNDPAQHGRTLPSKPGEPDEPRGKFLWVGAVLVHEFGHTVGLKHTTGSGIMNADAVLNHRRKEVQQADLDVVREIYHGHILNEGW